MSALSQRAKRAARHYNWCLYWYIRAADRGGNANRWSIKIGRAAVLAHRLVNETHEALGLPPWDFPEEVPTDLVQRSRLGLPPRGSFI